MKRAAPPISPIDEQLRKIAEPARQLGSLDREALRLPLQCIDAKLRQAWPEFGQFDPQRLGIGCTGSAYCVEDLDGNLCARIVKLQRTPFTQTDLDVRRRLHQRWPELIPQYYASFSCDTGSGTTVYAILMDNAGMTLLNWMLLQIPIPQALTGQDADRLYDSIVRMNAQGFLHLDLKTDNVAIRWPTPEETLRMAPDAPVLPQFLLIDLENFFLVDNNDQWDSRKHCGFWWKYLYTLPTPGTQAHRVTELPGPPPRSFPWDAATLALALLMRRPIFGPNADPFIARFLKRLTDDRHVSVFRPSDREGYGTWHFEIPSMRMQFIFDIVRPTAQTVQKLLTTECEAGTCPLAQPLPTQPLPTQPIPTQPLPTIDLSERVFHALQPPVTDFPFSS